MHEVNLESALHQKYDKQKHLYKYNEFDNKINEYDNNDDEQYIMTPETRAIVYGMQARAVQNMLDFDYICRRKEPSVSSIVYEFAAGVHHRQFYWGNS